MFNDQNNAWICLHKGYILLANAVCRCLFHFDLSNFQQRTLPFQISLYNDLINTAPEFHNT